MNLKTYLCQVLFHRLHGFFFNLFRGSARDAGGRLGDLLQVRRGLLLRDPRRLLDLLFQGSHCKVKIRIEKSRKLVVNLRITIFESSVAERL